MIKHSNCNKVELFMEVTQKCIRCGCADNITTRVFRNRDLSFCEDCMEWIPDYLTKSARCNFLFMYYIRDVFQEYSIEVAPPTDKLGRCSSCSRCNCVTFFIYDIVTPNNLCISLCETCSKYALKIKKPLAWFEKLAMSNLLKEM